MSNKKFTPLPRLIFPTVFIAQLSYNEKLEILATKLSEAYNKINELEDRVEALENIVNNNNL